MSYKKENRFNLSEKIYQKSILNVIKKDKIKYPIVVDLDLTTYCDLSCPECISDPILNTTQFKSEDVISLAKQVVEIGIKGVVLIGGGEPLIHNQASTVIKILGSAGVKVGLVTNGTLIDKHLDAIAKYVAWTRVSVDAGTKEIYGRFRPSKKKKNVFEKVISNMVLLSKVKKGDLGFSFLMMSRENGESNFQDIKIAGKLAKEIGCDYFELKSMFNQDHIVIKQEKSLVSQAKKHLDYLKSIQDDNFSIYDAFTYKELIEQNDSGTIQLKNYKKCPSSRLRKTITPHGIYPCAYHRNDERMKTNDLNKKTLKEALDYNIFEINPSVNCNFECARHELNMEYFKITENYNNIKEYDDYDIFI